jgi:hypothetical protein
MLQFLNSKFYFKKSIFPGITCPAGASTQTLLPREGWLLPGALALLELPKSARMAPPGIHDPQEPLWRASPLRRSTLAAVPAPQEQLWRATTLRRSKFSTVHPPPRRRETLKRCRQSKHMLNFTYEDDIKIKNKHVVGISKTFYLSIETISRPPQSRETIPLN